ncbi:BRO-N domain-containing protein [Treponema sp. R80B11-R83G3]
MNELAKIAHFYFERNPNNIRIIEKGDSRWFVAADVCDFLGIKKSGHTFSDIPENEKGWYIIPTLGGSQKMRIVNEAGLYRLVFKSRKPEAKRFQTWVFSEVLPSIRKYGVYRAAQPKIWTYRGKEYTWAEWVNVKRAAYFKRFPDATEGEFLATLPC